LRTAIKRFTIAAEGKDVQAAQKAFAVAIQKLDRAGVKKILHPNAVSRRKSQMALKLNALTASAKA
jgi:small subunit ribosomal protein S20